MWLSGGRAAWWQVFLGTLALVLPLAWLSWHGVEKWALRWVRGRRRPRPRRHRRAGNRRRVLRGPRASRSPLSAGGQGHPRSS